MKMNLSKTTYNAMTQEMLNACNKVNAELQAERFNTRMALIARCFEYDKFLGVDEKSLKTDPFYHNNYFDQLMDMKYWELEEFEIKMFKITQDYEESICKETETTANNPLGCTSL